MRMLLIVLAIVVGAIILSQRAAYAPLVNVPCPDGYHVVTYPNGTTGCEKDN